MVLDEVLSTQALAATISGVILLSCALLTSLALLAHAQRTADELARLSSIDVVLAPTGKVTPELGVKVRAAFGLPSAIPTRAPPGQQLRQQPDPAMADRPSDAAGRRLRGGSEMLRG